MGKSQTKPKSEWIQPMILLLLVLAVMTAMVLRAANHGDSADITQQFVDVTVTADGYFYDGSIVTLQMLHEQLGRLPESTGVRITKQDGSESSFQDLLTMLREDGRDYQVQASVLRQDSTL